MQNWSQAKTLNEKTGNYPYPVQNKWAVRSSCTLYAVTRVAPLSCLFCGQSQYCYFCFFVNSLSQPYNSMNQPNLSWSRARRMISKWFIKLAIGWRRCSDLNACAWQNDEFLAKRCLAFTSFCRASNDTAHGLQDGHPIQTTQSHLHKSMLCLT